MDTEKLNNFVAHGFLVDDINKQKHFYVNNLGYEIQKEHEGFVALENGPGGGLFLLEWNKIAESLGKDAISNVKHKSIQVIKMNSRQEVDEALLHLQGKANIIAKPCEKAWGVYAGYFVDTQNYLWEIYTWEK